MSIPPLTDRSRTDPASRSTLRPSPGVSSASSSQLHSELNRFERLRISYAVPPAHRGNSSSSAHNLSTLHTSGHRILRPPPSNVHGRGGHANHHQTAQLTHDALARASRSPPLPLSGYATHVIPGVGWAAVPDKMPYIVVGPHSTTIYHRAPLPRPRGVVGEDSQEFETIQIHKWSAGRSYAPVLTTPLAQAILAEPSINPLFLPSANDDRTHIKWNLLYPDSYARPSNSLSPKAWADRLNEPATFPRLSNIHVISPCFPWMIEIRSDAQDVALTCHDVIEQLHRFLYQFLSNTDMDTALPTHQDAMWESFDASRNPPDELPGRLLIGPIFNGLRHVEWLCGTTEFLGLDANSEYIRERVGVVIPGMFVLSCAKPPTVKESDQPAQVAESNLELVVMAKSPRPPTPEIAS
ncbi:hypothetical protein PLICRDRAFT_27158 [Plicaturopsis crispa FD-325 SS-3]|nr:hypothetical protein PLICRDRAFT_27158 [Plicaturopsis crispa FD-325 SS-3]